MKESIFKHDGSERFASLQYCGGVYSITKKNAVVALEDAFTANGKCLFTKKSLEMIVDSIDTSEVFSETLEPDFANFEKLLSEEFYRTRQEFFLNWFVANSSVEKSKPKDIIQNEMDKCSVSSITFGINVIAKTLYEAAVSHPLPIPPKYCN